MIEGASIKFGLPYFQVYEAYQCLIPGLDRLVVASANIGEGPPSRKRTSNVKIITQSHSSGLTLYYVLHLIAICLCCTVLTKIVLAGAQHEQKAALSTGPSRSNLHSASYGVEYSSFPCTHIQGIDSTNALFTKLNTMWKQCLVPYRTRPVSG